MSGNVLGGFGSAFRMGEDGMSRSRTIGDMNRLGRLSAEAYSAPKDQQTSLLAEMARVNPQAAQQQQAQLQGEEDRNRSKMVNTARYLENAFKSGDQAAIQGAYQHFKTVYQPHSGGRPLPDTVDESIMPALHQILASADGATGTNQNKVVGGAMVDPNGNVIYQSPANASIVEIDDGYGNKIQRVWNPQTQSLSPLPGGSEGGQPAQQQTPQQPQSGYVPGPSGPAYIEPGLSAEDMELVQRDIANSGRSDKYELPKRDVSQRGGGQAPQAGSVGFRPAKPAAAPAGYAWNPDGTQQAIPGGPAQVAAEARDAANAARADVARIKSESAKRAEGARIAASNDAAQALIDSIDEITSSAGFSDLGTVMGDAKLKTPYIRSDVKDSRAMLGNIGGKVALSTMAQLKSLSSSGATGFGALSAPELKLLENAIATLDVENISNAQLSRSLKTIRDTMAKVTSWKPPQQGESLDHIPRLSEATSQPQRGPQPGTVQGGYRFRGGNPADQSNWELL